MGKLCGWIGDDAPATDALAVVNRMLPGCGVSEVISRAHHKSATVAAHTDVTPASIAANAHLVAAMEGRAGGTDAAKLCELYARLGDGCLDHVSGSFSLVVLDLRTGEGLLAVDRMGTRGLCYATPPGMLVFGSTAEAVAAHPAVRRELSAQAVFNYLYCHMVPSPGTVFRGVQKLQPGECVVFRNGTAQPRFYWTMRYTNRAAEGIDALESRFRRLLRESAARAIGDDTEIGAFLSGGTDSSTVSGLLGEITGRRARTYSIGFRADGFDEMEYARITARHFNTDAREYYLTPQDVVDTIPKVAGTYDEPFGNASAVPTYLCAHLAHSDGVRVMLAGDGGDEIFGGNARYALQRVFQAYWVLPAALRHRVIEPVVLDSRFGQAITPWRKLKSYVKQAAVPLPDRLEAYNFLNRLPLSDILEPSFLSQVDPEQPLRLQRAAYERAAATSYVDRMMHLDLKFTLADNDLRKVSRMCELAGVEVRYPLIDDALVTFSGELPPDLKVKGLRLRHFFKQALQDFLPPETIAKKKHGFGLPFGLWLAEYPPLKALAHDSLKAFAARGILRPSYIQDLLRQHQSSHATYYGVMIWVITMLEQWLSARKA